MPVRPFSQDVLTRVINVHWGGGIVVAADNAGDIYRLKFGDKEWERAGGGFIDSGTGNTVALVGSSYALVDDEDPTFVMVGYGGGGDGLGHIYASKDGLRWDEVFTLEQEQPDRNLNTIIFAVVWEESTNTFWAAGHHELAPSEDDRRRLAIDLLFSSPNGIAWSESARHETVVGILDEPGYVPPDYTEGLLVEHCSDKVTDDLGNGVPDGFYKYDSSNEILVRPETIPTMEYLVGGISYGFPAGVIVTYETGSTPEVAIPDFPVICAAGVEGRWVIGGGQVGGEGEASSSCEAAIQVIASGGRIEWKPLNPPGDGPLLTMVAGAEAAEAEG